MNEPNVKKLRFAIVGAGAIAQAYASALKASTVCDVTVVADVRLDAAKALAEKLGSRAVGSIAELLAATDIDAAIVSTPPISHPEITIALLERGVHVLCEKPFAINHKSAISMIDASRRSGSLLTMASKFRYVKDVVEARRRIHAGAIGDVLQFENAFTGLVDMSNRWNSNPALSGGGVLIDNGTHSLDIARYFLGPLREINVVEGKRIKGSPVEDAVHVFARNENGVPANIDLSWSISKELDYYVRIYGSTGTISLGWKESKIRTKVGGPWEVFGAGYQRDAALAAQVENFIGAIRGDEPLCITTDDALASVRAVEAAYTALRASDSRWTLLEGSVARVAETNGKPASNGSGTLIGV